MKEIVAVNGIIRAKVLYYSISREGVYLSVWNDEDPQRRGTGWQSWNPHKLPAVGEVLNILCTRVTFRDSISRGTLGRERVVWKQVDFERR